MPPRAAGIIDKDIDPPEPRCNVLHQRRNCCRVGDIASDRLAPPAGRFADRLGGGRKPLGPAGDNGDIRPALRQHPRDGLADPGAAAGDQRRAA